jgi:hypothetical protein
MEITQQNFLTSMDLINESIDKADFIAIDLEFSGYSAGDEDKAHNYNTLEEKYQKLRSVINKFVAFQVGICTFSWD